MNDKTADEIVATIEKGIWQPSIHDIRRRTVCICGSVRFKQEFEEVRARLHNELLFILAPENFEHELYHTDETAVKEQFDILHFHKIWFASRVHFVNPDGYMGKSTCREYRVAKAFGKEITLEEPLFKSAYDILEECKTLPAGDQEQE